MVLLIAFCEASVYALTKPPVPNNMPPKYLVTIIITFVRFKDFNSASKGAPAVPDGSPSSLHFSICCKLLISILFLLY